MAQNFLDPIKHLTGPVLRRIVASGQTIVVGKAAKFGSYDDEIAAGGNDDELNCFVCVGPGSPGTSIAAGAVAEVIPVTGGPIVPCLVGSAGVTRGKAVKFTGGAWVDAADAAGSGTTEIPIFGIAMQTGVSGDYVGIAVCRAERIT